MAEMKKDAEVMATDDETEGRCRGCGETALLGNGLCAVCWDKGALTPDQILDPDASNTKTIPQYYRLQVRIVKMAKEKATSLGMKLPAYVSQLIVKDCEGKQ